MNTSLFDITNVEIILRLVVALALGVFLGLERNLARKTAGMRTYGLVSMGSALFIITAGLMSDMYLAVDATSRIDPLRMASQIVVGVGFIGAGLIIFKDSNVRGITTAVGLWVATGIGMAVGFGLYFLAICAAVLTLLAFTVLWDVEVKLTEKRKGLEAK